VTNSGMRTSKMPNATFQLVTPRRAHDDASNAGRAGPALALYFE
jgi:hypothetical protein